MYCLSHYWHATGGINDRLPITLARGVGYRYCGYCSTLEDTKVTRDFRFKFTVLSCLLLTIPPVVVSAQTTPAPPVPGAYLDLYNSLSGQINTFADEINAGWDQSPWPVAFAANLMTGNSDNG